MPAKLLSVNSLQNYHYLGKRLIHIALLSILINQTLFSQKTALILPGTSDSQVEVSIDKTIAYSDTLQLLNAVERNIFRLQSEGYLLASLPDIESINDSLVHISLFIGKRFKWADLKKGNAPEVLLSKVGYREKFYKHTPFKVKESTTLFKRILRHSQDNGYPFASVSLDSILIKGHSVTASLLYNRGPLILFDSLSIDEQVGVKRAWLQAYLGITPENNFNQTLIDRIEKKIEKLRFLELESTPEVTFQNERAVVVLRLKKVKSNAVDGIVGFLPNEKSDGGTLITGQFDLSLSNLFNSGKSIDVHWQSLKPRSQLLEVGYLHRNLFHSPLHFESSFYLLKEDTTFINRKGRFSFHYQPSSHEFSFFTRLESSRTIGSVATDVEEENISDFNINYYGLTYAYDQVVRIRAYSGFVTNLELAVGSKKLKNTESNLVSTTNPDTETTQYYLNGQLSWFRPISKSFGVMIKGNGGKLINDRLFLNDLFRVGGLQSLRGFNENFFFAEEYLIGTFELRLHYDQRSFLFAFYDQAYVYYNLEKSNFEDYPLGIGVGLSLSTNNGTLNLAYALGRSIELQQPLNLRLSKFHFGYVAKF